MLRLLGVFVFLFLTVGCGKEEPAFHWQVDSLPTNLDPQVAQGDSNLLALSHLYRGLYRLDEDGTPVKDGCLQLSENGLRYRLILSRRVFWSDGEPVRAADYAFALTRCLDPSTGSPYREQLSVIESISAPGPYILELTTAQQVDLPRLLSCPGAYPCRESFFIQSQGQYGLTRQTVLGNGRFTLQSWGTSIFSMVGREGTGIRQLRLILPGSSLPSSGHLRMDSAAPAAEVCVLALNPDHPLLQNQSLRKAISGMIQQTTFPLPEGGQRAEQLLPPIFGLEPVEPDNSDPLELLWESTAQLGCSSLDGLSILTLPETKALAQEINQKFESRLGIFCRIKELDAAQMEKALDTGAYSMAIMSIRAHDPDPQHFWAECGAYCGLEQPSAAQVQDSHCLVPLFYSAHQVEADPCWQGIQFSPFSVLPDFNDARYAP